MSKIYTYRFHDAKHDSVRVLLTAWNPGGVEGSPAGSFTVIRVSNQEPLERMFERAKVLAERACGDESEADKMCDEYNRKAEEYERNARGRPARDGSG